MHALPVRQIHHTVSHKEAMEIHARCAKCELRKLQKNSDLRDEIDPLAAACVFSFHHHAVEERRRPA
jgi:hypothetical protein